MQIAVNSAGSHFENKRSWKRFETKTKNKKQTRNKEIEHKMADTAAVAKPMAAPTPDKKKKKRKSTSSTSDTPTKSASNGASSSASPSSGKKSKKKEKKAESSNKDVMELEEPASKPKRKFDEQTKPTGKGKEKAHKSGNDEASLATDRRKRQRLSITSEKNRPAVAPSLGAISISTFNLIRICAAIYRSIFFSITTPLILL
jgi:hypothetical protein